MSPASDKILIVRFSSMGDILLATPLIRWMRKRFPGSVIDFAVREKYKELLEGNPNLNEILLLKEPGDFNCLKQLAKEARRRNYSFAVDIHTNFRNAYLCASIFTKVYRWKLPRFRRWLLVKWKKNLLADSPPVPLRYLKAVERLGVRDDGEGLEFFVSNEAEKRCLEIWNRHGFIEKKVAAIAPGAKWNTKRWNADKFAETGKKLLEGKCGALILLGSTDERRLCDEIEVKISDSVLNIAGETDFNLAGAILRKCALLISNDSGLSHLASAVNTPTVTIFGPTVKEFGFFPFRNRAIVLQRELSCRPCSHIGSDNCPEKHFRCMNDITVEEVLNASDNLLNFN